MTVPFPTGVGTMRGLREDFCVDEGGLEPLVEGQVVAGKYELVRPLARGGMGSVWLARHVSLETELAIKFMAPDLVASSHLRTRFKREAKAAAQLKSRHVVRVLDHGVDGEIPYIAMELLEGEDLKTRLRRERRLSLVDALDLLRQIGKALRQAHAAGIVHRDLKPANIFIARVDGEEVVKVLDFGVAKLTAGADDGESTRTGVVVGSPNYMSPEQARTVGDVDHRSDLCFALEASMVVRFPNVVEGHPRILVRMPPVFFDSAGFVQAYALGIDGVDSATLVKEANNTVASGFGLDTPIDPSQRVRLVLRVEGMATVVLNARVEGEVSPDNWALLGESEWTDTNSPMFLDPGVAGVAMQGDSAVRVDEFCVTPL